MVYFTCQKYVFSEMSSVDFLALFESYVRIIHVIGSCILI